MAALPAVLASKKLRTPLLLMVALAAVLLSKNCVSAPLFAIMVALPAVLLAEKRVWEPDSW